MLRRFEVTVGRHLASPSIFGLHFLPVKILDRARPWWLPPPGHVPASWWIAIGTALLGVDYALGISAEFPVLYVIPVSLAAWYSGRRPALFVALANPLLQLVQLIASAPAVDRSLALHVTMTLLRAAVIVIMALWVARLSEHERELHHEVQTLKGLLPICSFCKSIRNESGEWERLERFISRRSETEFSHGMCPSCLETQYPNLPRANA